MKGIAAGMQNTVSEAGRVWGNKQPRGLDVPAHLVCLLWLAGSTCRPGHPLSMCRVKLLGCSAPLTGQLHLHYISFLCWTSLFKACSLGPGCVTTL